MRTGKPHNYQEGRLSEASEYEDREAQMMNRDKILDKLKDIVNTAEKTDRSGREEVTEDMLLVKDLGFNSMKMLYMAVLIEENFQIRLENIKGLNLQTVGDVVDMIENKIKHEGEETL